MWGGPKDSGNGSVTDTVGPRAKNSRCVCEVLDDVSVRLGDGELVTLVNDPSLASLFLGLCKMSRMEGWRGRPELTNRPRDKSGPGQEDGPSENKNVVAKREKFEKREMPEAPASKTMLMTRSRGEITSIRRKTSFALRVRLGSNVLPATLFVPRSSSYTLSLLYSRHGCSKAPRCAQLRSQGNNSMTVKSPRPLSSAMTTVTTFKDS